MGFIEKRITQYIRSNSSVEGLMDKEKWLQIQEDRQQTLSALKGQEMLSYLELFIRSHRRFVLLQECIQVQEVLVADSSLKKAAVLAIQRGQ